METKKILITGASGKTAEAIVKHFRQETDYKLYLMSSKADEFRIMQNTELIQCSILDFQKVKDTAYDIKPDALINTAAQTDVDACETDKKLAQKLNVEAVENLVRIARVLDTHLITFSSDYIFDGLRGPYTETDRPNPLSYYGKTKHAAENAVLSAVNKGTIIRTNVVYGESSFGKNDFMKWIVDKLEKKEKIKIITGQYANPTFTEDIARAVLKIIQKERFGVYNAGGADWMNRYDIALSVADVFGFDHSLIIPIEPKKLKQKAQRPERGGLVTLKAETDLGIKFTSLRNGLSVLKKHMEQ